MKSEIRHADEERHVKTWLTSRPTAPLLPRTRDSAVVDPIRAVRAAISIRLLPKSRDAKADVRSVALDIVAEEVGAHAILWT